MTAAARRWRGTASPPSSSSVDTVGAYAVRGASGQAYVLLFNKATTNQSVQVTVAGGLSGSLALYGFDGSNRLGAMGTA